MVGFALWFLNYSTWGGLARDLPGGPLRRPGGRGQGHGKALLAELARICTERGYGRLEWWVLDWNSAARGFYESLGAVAMDEWTVHRLTGPALRALAAAAAVRRATGAAARQTAGELAALPGRRSICNGLHEGRAVPGRRGG